MRKLSCFDGEIKDMRIINVHIGNVLRVLISKEHGFGYAKYDKLEQKI